MAKLLLWNVGAINNKKMELMNNVNPYDIMIITETKLSGNKILFFKL